MQVKILMAVILLILPIIAYALHATRGFTREANLSGLWAAWIFLLFIAGMFVVWSL
jgi:hypothetical protein